MGLYVESSPMVNKKPRTSRAAVGCLGVVVIVLGLVGVTRRPALAEIERAPVGAASAARPTPEVHAASWRVNQTGSPAVQNGLDDVLQASVNTAGASTPS